MESKDDPTCAEELRIVIQDFYKKQGQHFYCVSFGAVGRGCDEGDHLYAEYLLDKKHVIKFTVPTAIRTYGVIYIGVGPTYIPIEVFISSKSNSKFFGAKSRKSIDSDLFLLNEYFAGELK